jgi:hypothetical protein
MIFSLIIIAPARCGGSVFFGRAKSAIPTLKFFRIDLTN